MGHILMENRNGLIVDAVLTQATGTAEREAAGACWVASGAGTGPPSAPTRPTTRRTSSPVCERWTSPRTSPRTPRPALGDRRPDHAPSRLRREPARAQAIEEAFGWMKTVGGLRKPRHRGKARVGWLSR